MVQLASIIVYDNYNVQINTQEWKQGIWEMLFILNNQEFLSLIQGCGLLVQIATNHSHNQQLQLCYNVFPHHSMSHV